MPAKVVACPSCRTKNRVPVVAGGRLRCASCHSDLPWLVEAGDPDFTGAVRTKLPVLLDLWAPWCDPCRVIAPTIEQASVELAGKLKVVKVNVDEAPLVSARFQAQSIPTLLILRNGEPVARQVGALPANRLLDWVRQSIA